MTYFISVGTQELLLDLFEDTVSEEALERLSKLSKEELDAINNLMKESGC